MRQRCGGGEAHVILADAFSVVLVNIQVTTDLLLNLLLTLLLSPVLAAWNRMVGGKPLKPLRGQVRLSAFARVRLLHSPVLHSPVYPEVTGKLQLWPAQI